MNWSNRRMGRWVATLALAITMPVVAAAQEQTAVALQGKNVNVKYSAASAAGRKIFGAAVPYGQVWRIGEKSAPALHTDANLAFYGLTVPKGDYALFLLPAADKWELIIARQAPDAPYNPKTAVGRVQMVLRKAPAPVDMRKITITATATLSAKLEIAWEDTVASAPFRVDLVGRDTEW